MASALSPDVEASDLSLYTDLKSNNIIDYLESSSMGADMPVCDVMNHGLSDNQHISLKHELCKVKEYAVSKMTIAEKYVINTDAAPTTLPGKYASGINSLTGMQSFENDCLSCSDNQGLSGFSEVSGNDVQNLANQCELQASNENSNYQLMELASISKSPKQTLYRKNEAYNACIELIEEGKVIAVSRVIKVSGLRDHLKFDCIQCGCTFLDRTSALIHLTVHSHLEPFQCVSCNSQCSTEAEARLHFKSHSLQREESPLVPADTINQTLAGSVNKNLHQCCECKSVFDSVEALTRHKILLCSTSNSNNSNHNCSSCNEKFLLPTLLESHVKSVHSNSIRKQNADKKGGTKCNKGKERKWICKICEKAFRTCKALQEHEVVHTGARDFPCNICGKAFGTATNMRIHVMTHSDQKPFSCLTCGAAFRQKDSLKVHVRKHTGERPFVCSVCHMAFDRTFTLKNHMLKHAEKSFVCSVCGKAFSTRGGLNNHERLHFKDPSQPRKERQPRSNSGTGSWVCDECGKIYSTRSNLKMHKKSHEPTQIYHVCPVCSQSYKSRDSMEVHMRRHTEERPFKCTMCPRSFYRNYTLKIHILTHTGEKPHCCPVEGCTKSFAQTSSLSYHIRNHKKREGQNHIPSTKKQMCRKRKSAQENCSVGDVIPCSANLNPSNHLENCEIPSISESEIVTDSLKLSSSALMTQNLSGNIVESMFEDMTQHIDTTLPAVWDENEGAGIMGVIHDLHHSTQTQNNSVNLDLDSHHCQHVSLMQYVPDALPLLVGVSDSTLYEPDSIQKAFSEQPMLVPHIP